MQRLLSIGLSALLLLSLMSTSLIVLRFKQDQQRIAMELCVQRELPAKQNTCNGQCHLKKQLKQAEPSSSDKDAPKELRLLEIAADLLTKATAVNASEGYAYVRISHHYMLLAGAQGELEGVPWS